jgi:hypothetical protein
MHDVIYKRTQTGFCFEDQNFCEEANFFFVPETATFLKDPIWMVNDEADVEVVKKNEQKMKRRMIEKNEFGQTLGLEFDDELN